MIPSSQRGITDACCSQEHLSSAWSIDPRQRGPGVLVGFSLSSPRASVRIMLTGAHEQCDGAPFDLYSRAYFPLGGVCMRSPAIDAPRSY